jgi:hypothetical protein
MTEENAIAPSTILILVGCISPPLTSRWYRPAAQVGRTLGIGCEAPSGTVFFSFTLLIDAVLVLATLGSRLLARPLPPPQHGQVGTYASSVLPELLAEALREQSLLEPYANAGTHQVQQD